MTLIGKIDLRAAAAAGASAGIAYLAMMEVDNRLTGQKLDDLLILGRPFVEDPSRARKLGVAIHLANAATLGVVYAAFMHDRLPGPAWLRGVIFGNVENTTLYPLALLEQAHPAVRAGEVDRYWTVPAYLQSIPRHVAYGAVLGWLYERLRRSR
jgi:hypothetical protein